MMAFPDDCIDDRSAKARDSISSAIRWDGVLPLVVATSRLMLRALFPKNDGMELFAVLFVPILAALFRAAHGTAQMHARGILATAGRQVSLACAIVSLILFDIYSGALLCAPDAPPTAWLFAGAMYMIYLMLIRLTLCRPEINVAVAGNGFPTK